MHRFCAELLLALPATHHEPTSYPDGGGPTWRHTTGNWRIDFVALPLLSAGPMRTLGNMVSLEKITKLPQWMFPFSSLVLVTASTKTSLPGEHSSSQMLLSVQKPFGGQCLAGPITGTLTQRKFPSPSLLVLSLQQWLHLQRGAQKQTGSRQILGQLLSSTENVGIISSRGSGSASPFSYSLPFGLGALPPFVQAQKANTNLYSNRLESALQARFLQSVAEQAAKAAQADHRSWLRRQAISVQADLNNGVSTSLWSFLRYLSKNKARRGPKPTVVLRTPQGDIASTPEDLARIWQDTFFREIDRRGEIIPKCAFVPFASQMLDTTTPPPVVDAPCLLDIYSSTVNAISKAVAGKATGPDLIPVEFLKAGSSPLCLLLFRLFAKVGDYKAPLTWRWGENVPVPKKFDKPLTPDTPWRRHPFRYAGSKTPHAQCHQVQCCCFR